MNQKTYMQAKEAVKREWRLYDLSGKILGRAANEIASLLTGKGKVTYTPHTDAGDYVVVINAKEVKVTKNKAQNKLYYWHSGFPGGLKKRTFKELLEEKPEMIVKRAVKNMIPNNKSRKARLARLKIYPNASHPHAGQIKEMAKKEEK